jgi:hypothetical protein
MPNEGDPERGVVDHPVADHNTLFPNPGERLHGQDVAQRTAEIPANEAPPKNWPNPPEDGRAALGWRTDHDLSYTLSLEKTLTSSRSFLDA